MSVLDDIIVGVREDLRLREERVPLRALKERAARIPGAKETRCILRNMDAVSYTHLTLPTKRIV